MHEEQKPMSMTKEEQQRKIKQLEMELLVKEGAEVRSVGTKVHSDLHRGHQRITINHSPMNPEGEPNPQYREREDTVQLGPKPIKPVADNEMEQNAFVMAAGQAAIAAAAQQGKK